ncbi:hypothetical protein HI914_04404 [Erysiphe necator]|nr:hypothetical protein HI914_04404 [Erysiphe necator]
MFDPLWGWPVCLSTPQYLFEVKINPNIVHSQALPSVPIVQRIIGYFVLIKALKDLRLFRMDYHGWLIDRPVRPVHKHQFKQTNQSVFKADTSYADLSRQDKVQCSLLLMTNPFLAE